MTSIEWLIQQLQAPCRGIPSHIIEQAKQIHKQEIIDAWKDGEMYNDEPSDFYAEQYYNNTFKKD